MKSEWQKYAAKIDAMSLRERIILFGGLLLVIVYIAFMVFIDPAQQRKKVVSAELEKQRAEMQVLQIQIADLAAKRGDPDAANLARRNGLGEQIAGIEVSLKDMNQTLVPAQNMKALLQEMLTHQPRLQLVALKTLPVTPLVEKKEKAEKTEKTDAANGAVPAPVNTPLVESNVFKHGVEITLQGSYADLYEYLTRVEKLQWRMFWSRASLNAEDSPRLKLTVTIYTLSLDKAWLVV
jgi:MSHA biogenesis protein MshJ